MALGRTALRLTVGGLVAGHGLQKLKGAFGGPGLEGTEQMMRALGLHPPRQHALAVAISETVGGALTAAGLFSPIGPAMITGSQAVAVKKVHLEKGPWITNGGFEYNAVLMAAAFCLAADGPGALSLDGLFGKKRSGLRWGLLELILAGGAAAATLAIAEKMRPAESSSSEPGSSSSSSSESGDDHSEEAPSTSDEPRFSESA